MEQGGGGVSRVDRRRSPRASGPGGYAGAAARRQPAARPAVPVMLRSMSVEKLVIKSGSISGVSRPLGEETGRGLYVGGDLLRDQAQVVEVGRGRSPAGRPGWPRARANRPILSTTSAGRAAQTCRPQPGRVAARRVRPPPYLRPRPRRPPASALPTAPATPGLGRPPRRPGGPGRSSRPTTSGVSNGTLYSAANRAASAGVRRLPLAADRRPAAAAAPASAGPGCRSGCSARRRRRTSRRRGCRPQAGDDGELLLEHGRTARRPAGTGCRRTRARSRTSRCRARARPGRRSSRRRWRP